jgi:hypothetical protein
MLSKQCIACFEKSKVCLTDYSPPSGILFHYHLQTCISVGFAPPMLNAQILIDDFEHMWKIHDREFWEYLT